MGKAMIQARYVRLFYRAAGLLVIVLVVHQISSWAMGAAQSIETTQQILAFRLFIAGLFAAYVTLMAVPFVPGIEIGIAILMLQGPAAAPYIYLATVSGLLLAYLAGRYVSLTPLENTLRDLHLTKAADLLAQLKPMSPARRLALLRQRLPTRLAPQLVRWRYPLLALLVNLPGNSLIGGGGGICLIAGLSGIFAPRATLITLLVAVSPVPLGLWFLGMPATG